MALPRNDVFSVMSGVAVYGGRFNAIGAVDVTTLGIEGTGTESVAFGHAFEKGAVPAGAFAVLTDESNVPLSTQQCTIKSTWSDGSAKHAVLAAQVVGGTTYKVRRASKVGGANLTVEGLLAAFAGNIATVTLSGGVTGVATLRDLLESAANRAAGGVQTLEQGPAMLSLAVARNFATHLRVNFHVRWFGGSVLRVDFILENGYGDVAGQGDLSYTAVLDLNGTTVLNTGAITHWNHAMWHRAAWTSGGTLYAKHNVAYLRDKVTAVPYYDPSATPSGAFLNTLPTTRPAPMTKTAFWSIPDNTDATGDNSHIGILPQWDALYVKAGGDKRAFDAMLAGVDSCMAHRLSYLSSVDGEHIRTSDFPTATIAGTSGFGSGAFDTANPNHAQSGWIASHSPATGYLAYLLTGDLAYQRAMAAWACEHSMYANTGNNTTYSGMNVRLFYRDQKRGWGWSYAKVAQASWALPDTHPAKTYLTNEVKANFARDHAEYVSPGTALAAHGGGSMGFLYDWDWEHNNVGWYSGFMHAFLSQAVSYVALDLGFTDGLDFAKYAGKFIAGLMGSTGEFPFEFGPQYSFVPGASQGAYYTTWAQFRANTSNLPVGAASLDSGTTQMASQAQAFASGSGHTGVLNEVVGNMGSALYYYANYLPAISYLERLGVDGGWACWLKARICGRLPDFTQTPQFGIFKRDLPLPAYIAAQPLLHWYRIPNTAPSSVNPTSGTYMGSPSGRIHAWSGATLKVKGSDYGFVASGGHNDYSGNEFISLVLRTVSPAWRFVDVGTPFAQVTQQQPVYADGKPSSRHIYYNEFAIDGLDKILLHGCTYENDFIDAPAVWHRIDMFNLKTNTYEMDLGAATEAGWMKPIAKSCTTELVYYCTTFRVNNPAFYVYRPGLGTVTEIAAVPVYEEYRAMAIDPKRGRALVTCGAGSQTGRWDSIDLSTGVSTSRSAAVGLDWGQGIGAEYDPDGDRYLVWNGGDIYTIDPDTFAATPLGMTGTAPGTSIGGILGKFRYAPEVRCVVMVDSNDNDVAMARMSN